MTRPIPRIAPRRTGLLRAACVGATLLAAAPALAQTTITSYTIDCGGGVITGGNLRLTSTIGQHDAGGTLIGGTLLERGGFLASRQCVADFNNSGTATVQDIFDFLAAWFAGTATANFNSVNGITVQDIFDFLAAWFAGC